MSNELDIIRALVELGDKATPGEWRDEYLGDQGGCFVLHSVPMVGCLFNWDEDKVVCTLMPTCCHDDKTPVVYDTQFIAASKNAIPALRAMLARLEKLEGALQEIAQRGNSVLPPHAIADAALKEAQDA